MQMRMCSKKLEKNAKNLKKEEKKNMEKAEAHLKKGDEEIARLYIQNTQSNRQDYLKHLKLSHNLDGLTEKIKLNDATNKVVGDVNDKVLPYFKQETSEKNMNNNIKAQEDFRNVMQHHSILRKVFRRKVDDITHEKDLGKEGEKVLGTIKNKMEQEMKSKEKKRVNKQAKAVGSHAKKQKVKGF